MILSVQEEVVVNQYLAGVNTYIHTHTDMHLASIKNNERQSVHPTLSIFI